MEGGDKVLTGLNQGWGAVRCGEQQGVHDMEGAIHGRNRYVLQRSRRPCSGLNDGRVDTGAVKSQGKYGRADSNS